MKFKKLKDFMQVGVANYVARAISALISILLARWLGPSGFGIFSIGLYTMTILGMGLAGLDQSYVHFSVRNPKKEKEFFTNYFLMKTIISFFIIALFSIISLLLFGSITETKSIVILYGLFAGMGLQLFRIVLSNFQAKKNFYLYSRSTLIYYSLLLFLVLLGLQFNIDKFFYYFLCYMISGIAIIVFKKLKLFLSKFNLEIIDKFWRFGKWLIFFHLLKLVNERIDFFWLTRSYSGEILGQYSAALKLVTVFAVLMGTFPILLLPEASSMKNIKDLKRYWRGCVKIIILLLLTWIIIFAFADFIVEILFGTQYIQATPILRILLVSLIPLIFTPPLEFIFLSIEKTIHLFIIAAIQSCSIFIVIPIFVNRIGFLGAAYAKIFSYSVTLIAYVFFYYKYDKKIVFSKLHSSE